MSRSSLALPVGLHRRGSSGAWRSRAAALGLAVGLALVSIEVGRIVVGGSVRNLSAVLGLVIASLGAQLAPSRLLAVVLALSPLPLYVQGLSLSLTIPLVAAVWLSLLASLPTRTTAVHSLGLRGYRLPLIAIGATSLLTLWRGTSDRTGADLGALGRLAVGMALFGACLVLIRSMRDLRLAFAAIGMSAVVVFGLSMLQLAFPSLHIPGLLSTAPGEVQQNLYGITSDLRVTGPFGDYELLAEFFALTGTMGAYLGLRTSGPTRVRWLLLVPLSFIGIAVTATLGGLIVLALGCALSVIGRGASGSRLRLLPVVVGIWLLGLPLLHTLQTRAGTGFLFNRLSAIPTGGGLGASIDRGGVWSLFMSRLPHGIDLLLGKNFAFNFNAYGTYPHSLPLTLLFTVGILGGLAFYWLLGAVLWHSLAGIRAGAPYAALGGLLVLLFIVDEVKIEYLRVFSYQWFVWGLLGVCAAAARMTEDDAKTVEALG